MLVLVVDDDEGDVSELIEYMQASEIGVDYVSCTDDAVDAMKGKSYHALVTDFNMDRLDGKQLIRLVKGRFEEDSKRLSLETITLDNLRQYDTAISDVVEEHFEDINDYKAFVRRLEHIRIVLFSSQQYGDGDPDDKILEEVVYIAQKKRARAEEGIIAWLKGEYG